MFPFHLPFTFLCLPFPTTLTRQCVHSHLHLIPDLLSCLYFSNCVSDRLSGLDFYGSLIKGCFYAWALQNNHHNYNHNHNNGLLSWEPFLCCKHFAACFTWIILFLFHNSERQVQILFLLYRKGKDLKEFASSPHSMWSLGSATAFFPCFSSSKIYAHTLFHFPTPFLFCIKYNIFYPVLYGGPICFLHVLCVK